MIYLLTVLLSITIGIQLYILTRKENKITQSSKNNLLNKYEDEEDKRILEEFYKAGLIKAPTKESLNSTLTNLKEQKNRTGKSYAELMKGDREDKRDPLDRIFDEMMETVSKAHAEGKTQVSFRYKDLGFQMNNSIEYRFSKEGFTHNSEYSAYDHKIWHIYW